MLAAGVADQHLGVALGAAVERQRCDGRLFGRHALDLAVGRAGRGEDQPLAPAHGAEHVAGAVDVGGGAHLRVGRAGRVADDRGQVEDPVGVFHRLGDGGGVANIALDDLDARVRREAEQGLGPVHERVEDDDSVAFCQEHGGQHRADVASAAGDQHLRHGSDSILMIGVHPCWRLGKHGGMLLEAGFSCKWRSARMEREA